MGHINPAPIIVLTNNTSPGTPASSAAMDGAILEIVDKVNENYDLAQATELGFTNHKTSGVLDHPDGSVTTSKIGDGQVTTSKFPNGAVTTPKIANRNVTREKIEIAAVGYQELDPTLTTLIPNIAIQMKFQDIDVQLADTEQQITDLDATKANQTSLDETNANITILDSNKMDNNTTNISVVQINKNLGLLDETYMTEAFLQQMAGTTPVNAVPANYSLTQKKMVTPYVEGKVGQNLFDTRDFTDNQYLNNAGTPTAGAGFGITDYLSITPSTTYTVRNDGAFQNTFAYYTSGKTLISVDQGGAGSRKTVTTPSNAVFIRISFTKSYVNSCQFVQGSDVLNPYIPFRFEFDESKIYAPLSKDKLNGEIVYGLPSPNLFDKSKVTVGMYVVPGNGTLSAATGYNASDWMQVLPSTDFVLSGENYVEAYAFYTSSKVYISGGDGNLNIPPRGHKITTPSNAAFARFSVRNTYLDTFQFEKGSYPTEYTAFGIKTDKNKIANFSPKGTFVVAKSNGDYTSINEALSKVRDTSDNPITLLIMPGVYEEHISIRNRHISLVGVNKRECIIVDHSGEYWNSPIEVAGKSYIANLTIIADSTEKDPEYTGLTSYAIHADFAGEGVTTIYNCDLIVYQHACIGIGLHNNQTIVIDSCNLYNHGGTSGAILAHNNQFNTATNQKLIVKNCVGVSDTGILLELSDANLTHGDGGDAKDTVFTFYNNMFYSKTLGKTGTVSVDPAPTGPGKIAGNIALGPDSYGNNLTAINAP